MAYATKSWSCLTTLGMRLIRIVDPSRCLDDLCYCKSAANPQIAEIPRIYGFFPVLEGQTRRKPVGGGKKIAHR